MALPRFCVDCGDILGEIEPSSRLALCLSCSKPHELDDKDKTVLIITDITDDRKLTERECNNLHGLPTVSRITKKCPKCGYGVASVIHDINYNFSVACLKCKELFN